MITFLLILADISILAIAYIRFQVILHNLARKHGTTVSTLLDSCSNLAAIYDDKNKMIIMSIVSKIAVSLSALSQHDGLTDALICFIILDLILIFIFIDYYANEDFDGFYVKTNDEIKLRKRHIKF